MDAANSLQDGFRLGEWLVEPRAGRASRQDTCVDLTPDQARLLVALAARHGEAVDRRELRATLWPGQPAAEDRLRQTVAELRTLLGDRPRQPRYLASVGHDAYALIAHFEPLSGIAVAAATAESARPSSLHWWLTELRRRHVLKVAASYLVVTWIVLQVAEVTFAPLRFPDWWMTVLTIVAIIGLPIIVVLAWTYEITPEGVVVDPGSGAVRMPRPRQSLAPAIVAGVVLMAAVTGLAWWRSLEGGAPAPVPAGGDAGAPSIAVLPLVDMSAEGGDAWLGDGLSEELATRLAQVPGLRVAARTSSFEFRGRNIDVRRIGESLGVGHLLEGSVRRDGGTVRVTVQLIDARTGYHVWAGNFDRPWLDVLALQDEVAASVTRALSPVLRDDGTAGSDADEAIAADGDRVNAEAIEPYLEGLALLRRSGDRSALEAAARRFEAAVAADPTFGRAHAGLCTAGVARYRQTRDPADLLAAERSCREALKVAPGLIENERALAGLYVASGRFETAAGMYRTLLGSDGTNADDHTGLAQALEGMGRLEEAEASLRQATTVEPSFWGAHRALGGFLFARGRMAEAAAVYRRAAELAPSSASAWNNLGAALFMQGDAAGAIPIYQKSLALEPSRSALSNLATVYYHAGRFPEAIDTYTQATAVAPNDQTLWGNLADAQWQLPERRNAAIASYERAISLAERDLGIGEPSAMLRAQLGYYHARVGNCPRGRAHVASALNTGSDQMYVQYFAALAAIDCGEMEKLEHALAEALRLGYPKALLDIDPALKGKLPPRTGASSAHL